MERYTGPYRDDAKPMIEAMLRAPQCGSTSRVRSWDHRKLGMPAMPVGGTTCA